MVICSVQDAGLSVWLALVLFNNKNLFSDIIIVFGRRGALGDGYFGGSNLFYRCCLLGCGLPIGVGTVRFGPRIDSSALATIVF